MNVFDYADDQILVFQKTKMRVFRNILVTVDKPTGKVKTYIPSEPTATKSVTLGNGKDSAKFKSAETPKDALKLNKNKEEYTWKLDFKLPNYTEYTKIEFSDVFEKLQTIDNNKFKVYDIDGKDVTNRGKLEVKDDQDKTILTWVANADYVKAVNDRFGKNSELEPKFKTLITTDLNKATRSEKAKYINKDTGYIVIPNIGKMTLSDVTGTINVDTNRSFVTPPNELFTPLKKVSDDDEKLVDTNWTGLKVREQVYDISIETDKGYGFAQLEMSDQLPEQFTTTNDKIKVLLNDKDDISNKFDISIKNNLVVVKLKHEFLQDQSINDSKITTKIMGSMPEWIELK